MEDSDEDIEDSSQPPRTAVLWEKSFEQSIFVDLSEDESLHFSDLESSFPVRLTQESASSDASLHLSGKGLSSSQITVYLCEPPSTASHLYTELYSPLLN